MKTTITILTICLLTFAGTQTANAQKAHKTYYDNGNIQEEGQYDENGMKTGEWKYYDKE